MEDANLKNSVPRLCKHLMFLACLPVLVVAVEAQGAGRVLMLFHECGGGLDNVRPALVNLGITEFTVVYDDPNFASKLLSDVWDLVIVDSYKRHISASSMDELVNYYDGGGRVIFAYCAVYFEYSAHPFLDRAGVTLSGEYLSPEPIYSWIETPLFSAPNPVPAMTLFNDLCNVEGQYVEPVTASAHAGYTTSPTAGQAAITIDAQSRLILNAFAPQVFDKDEDDDGKIDMVELYENEINFLIGCLPAVPTNPSPADGAAGVPIDANLSWEPWQAIENFEGSGLHDREEDAQALDLPAMPDVGGLSVLYFGTYEDTATRLEDLGYNVTSTTNVSDLTRSNLNNYKVLFVDVGTDPSMYASGASEIQEWVFLDGGGLLVVQPHVNGAVITAYPPGFEVKITCRCHGPAPYAATIVDPMHAIVQGLTNADLPGDFDSVDQTDIGPSWDIIAVDAVVTNEVALLAGEYGAGRLAFSTGNFRPVSYDPGSDCFLIHLLDWLGARLRPTTYDVYLWTDLTEPVRICSDVSGGPQPAKDAAGNPEPICDPGTLRYWTRYYWKVAAKNRFGETEGPAWSFTTVHYPCWDYATQCHGDSDNDGEVKGSDFLALKASWYKCHPDPDYDPCADFDRDGCVKGSDFLILKSNWLASVPADCPPGGTWPPQP